MNANSEETDLAKHCRTGASPTRRPTRPARLVVNINFRVFLPAGTRPFYRPSPRERRCHCSYNSDTTDHYHPGFTAARNAESDDDDANTTAGAAVRTEMGKFANRPRPRGEGRERERAMAACQRYSRDVFVDWQSGRHAGCRRLFLASSFSP